MPVGQALAEARVERGLSVEDVAAATRIRSTLIRDIEADDFHSCGGDVYARGHIRSIARVLGIDARPLIGDYDAAHHVEPLVVPTAPEASDQHALAHTERRRPNWTLAMVAALLAIIAVAAYTLVGSHNGGKAAPAAHRRQGPIAQQSTPPAISPPTKPRVAKHREAELSRNKAIMLVTAQNQTTWLEISNAQTGATIYMGDLSPGQRKHVSEPYALNFTIGNAPAVDLVVNGKDLGTPKTPDSVLRGTIKPGSRQIQVQQT